MSKNKHSVHGQHERRKVLPENATRAPTSSTHVRKGENWKEKEIMIIEKVKEEEGLLKDAIEKMKGKQVLLENAARGVVICFSK